MTSKLDITPEGIKEMSYTDFVGFINQWNVPPGSYSTISKWATFGKVDESSHVLEIACTTGFSLREMATLTGCSGVGIDISRASVSTAKFNKEQYAPETNLEFVAGDANEYVTQESFSHVIVGAALKFFQSPEQLVGHIVNSFLVDGGVLLASPFFVTKEVPTTLIDQARDVFGITITTESYKEVMSVYHPFELLYEDRCTLVQETETELEYYCKSIIDRAIKYNEIADAAVHEAMYERLYDIKKMSNILREFQKYSVLVLRARSSVYPNRFTELF